MENFGLNLPNSSAVIQNQQQTTVHSSNFNNPNYTELNSSCSSLGSVTSTTNAGNMDLNLPCENTLRSWGSTVSLKSNTSSTSSNPATPTSLHSREAKDNKTNCGVCEDKASGKHYGVMTCEGKQTNIYYLSIYKYLYYTISYLFWHIP